MSDPLYPDEGVRAALEAARDAMNHVFMACPVPAAGPERRAWSSLVDAIQAADAALSTPVPEEGLTRGSASAAEGGVQASEPASMYLIRKGGGYYRPNAQGYTTIVSEAGRFTLDEAIAHSHPNGPDGPRDGISYVPASALPSPLPSQGEPVAGIFTPEKRIALLTEKVNEQAEALAAERARADRAEGDVRAEIDNLRDELACTYEELVEHTGDSLDDARTKRIEELRRTILKETPHDER